MSRVRVVVAGDGGGEEGEAEREGMKEREEMSMRGTFCGFSTMVL